MKRASPGGGDNVPRAHRAPHVTHRTLLASTPTTPLAGPPPRKPRRLPQPRADASSSHAPCAPRETDVRDIDRSLSRRLAIWANHPRLLLDASDARQRRMSPSTRQSLRVMRESSSTRRTGPSIPQHDAVAAADADACCAASVRARSQDEPASSCCDWSTSLCHARTSPIVVRRPRPSGRASAPRASIARRPFAGHGRHASANVDREVARAAHRAPRGNMSPHLNRIDPSFADRPKTYVSPRCHVATLPRCRDAFPIDARDYANRLPLATARRRAPCATSPARPPNVLPRAASRLPACAGTAPARTKKSPRARARGDFFGLSQLPDDSGKPHAVLTLPRPSASSAREPSRARWPASPGTSALRP